MSKSIKPAPPAEVLAKAVERPRRDAAFTDLSGAKLQPVGRVVTARPLKAGSRFARAR